MNNKKFIACIYLFQAHAVNNLKDMTVIFDDPVLLAKKYSESNIDALLIFDMSDTDTEHECSLDIMKEICAAVDVDVYGAGNVKRMEDIKKILYAGCKKAVLNFSRKSNIEPKSCSYGFNLRGSEIKFCTIFYSNNIFTGSDL